MKGPLYRFSAATVSFARLLEAGFNLGLALVLVLVVLWLTLSLGLNWLIIGLDILLGLSAAQLFVKACTVYSTVSRRSGLMSGNVICRAVRSTIRAAGAKPVAASASCSRRPVLGPLPNAPVLLIRNRITLSVSLRAFVPGHRSC